MTVASPRPGPAPGGFDRRTLLASLACYAASRAVLLAIGWLVLAVDPATAGAAAGPWSDLLCRWDCGWYLGIAERGYDWRGGIDDDQTNLAFYPLYPLTVRAVAWATGWTPLHAALLASNACFLGALLYIHRYARALGASPRAALLAVAIVCVLPQGVVFSAAYTESLFLLLLAASMDHLRRGHWLRAGFAAALLTATRATGVFFLAFALVHLWRVHGWRGYVFAWRRPEAFIPVVLAPAGLFAWWTWCWLETGDPFASVSTVSHGWGWRTAAPWSNLAAHLRYDAVSRFWALGSLAVAALSLLLLRRRWYAEFALCASVFAVLWSGMVPNSLLRYSIVLFPVWIALALELEGRPLRTALAFTVLGGFAAFTMAMWSMGRLVAI